MKYDRTIISEQRRRQQQRYETASMYILGIAVTAMAGGVLGALFAWLGDFKWN